MSLGALLLTLWMLLIGCKPVQSACIASSQLLQDASVSATSCIEPVAYVVFLLSAVCVTALNLPWPT